MAISRKRIATISEWKSNCVVAVCGDYLGEQLRADKLSAPTATALLTIFKDYYYQDADEVPELTAADLKILLSHKKYFPTPNHSQEILGCALRHFVKKSGVVAEDNNQLSLEAFAPIAEFLKFGIKFYMLEQGENPADEALIKEMPDIAVNPKLPNQLAVIWHNCVDIKDPHSPIKNDFHFDRIMTNELAAVLHDSHLIAQVQSGASRDRELQRDDEAAMQQQIRDALAEIRGVHEEKEQASEQQASEHKSATFIPYGTGSSPRRPPMITPSTDLSLHHMADEKTADEVPGSPAQEKWQAFVSQEIEALNLAVVDATSLNKESQEFNAPLESRLVLYSIWNNQAVVVKAKTQEKWDHELALRLQAEEEQEAAYSVRPS